MKRVAMGALIIALTPCAARADGEPLTVFECPIGAKRLSIVKTGDRYVYRFGTSGKDELSIVGEPAAGTLFQLSERYAGPEFQLRFRNGDFSYIVYSAEGNPSVGAKSIAGVIVLKASRQVYDRLCSRFVEFQMPPDAGSIPGDSESFAAMSVGG